MVHGCAIGLMHAWAKRLQRCLDRSVRASLQARLALGGALYTKAFLWSRNRLDRTEKRSRNEKLVGRATSATNIGLPSVACGYGGGGARVAP
jgi:hypothetical protein